MRNAGRGYDAQHDADGGRTIVRSLGERGRFGLGLLPSLRLSSLRLLLSWQPLRVRLEQSVRLRDPSPRAISLLRRRLRRLVPDHLLRRIPHALSSRAPDPPLAVCPFSHGAYRAGYGYGSGYGACGDGGFAGGGCVGGGCATDAGPAYGDGMPAYSDEGIQDEYIAPGSGHKALIFRRNADGVPVRLAAFRRSGDGSQAFERGVEQYRDGAHQQALSAFEDATSAEPGNALYQYYQALTLYELSGPDAASDSLRRAVALERQSRVENWGRRMERVQGQKRVWIRGAPARPASARGKRPAVP